MSTTETAPTNPFAPLLGAVKPFEGIILGLIQTQLENNKAYIKGLVDPEISNAGTSVESAIAKGFGSSENTILALVEKPLLAALDNFITSLETTGETDFDTLYDKLTTEVATLASNVA